MSTARIDRSSLGLRTAMFAIAMALALSTATAFAQIDVSGRWKVTYHSNFGDADESITLVQTGSTLTVSAPARYTGGTINPVTGVLHVAGPVGCAGIPAIIDAVASPDGSSFSGTFEDSFRPTLSCLVVNGTVDGVRLPDTCGNHVVDPGEGCDTGTSPTACCDEYCTPAPTGTSCRVTSGCAQTAQCNAVGACVEVTPKASGTVCRAKENTCDTAEVCNGTSFTCPPPSGPTEPDVDGDGVLDPCDDCVGLPLENVKLKLGRFGVGPTDDSLSLKARVRLPAPGFARPDFLTKVVELHDANGAAIVDEHIPGTTISGPPFEWKQKGTGWLFTNPQKVLTQVTRMQLKPSRRDATAWDVKVDMPHGTLPDDVGTAPLVLEVELNRHGGPSTGCGRIVFGPPGAPSPSCSAPNGKGIVKCR